MGEERRIHVSKLACATNYSSRVGERWHSIELTRCALPVCRAWSGMLLAEMLITALMLYQRGIPLRLAMDLTRAEWNPVSLDQNN